MGNYLNEQFLAIVRMDLLKKARYLGLTVVRILVGAHEPLPSEICLFFLLFNLLVDCHYRFSLRW